MVEPLGFRHVKYTAIIACAASLRSPPAEGVAYPSESSSVISTYDNTNSRKSIGSYVKVTLSNVQPPALT